eukprot:645562-Hanusia_phi.AAC.4
MPHVEPSAAGPRSDDATAPGELRSPQRRALASEVLSARRVSFQREGEAQQRSLTGKKLNKSDPPPPSRGRCEQEDARLRVTRLPEEVVAQGQVGQRGMGVQACSDLWGRRRVTRRELGACSRLRHGGTWSTKL